ncbi:helix-turn-helix domain-containing protein [Paenibacillus contaminans]
MRLIGTTEQESMIRQTFGSVRFLYNQMLAERKDKSEYDQADAERPNGKRTGCRHCSRRSLTGFAK